MNWLADDNRPTIEPRVNVRFSVRYSLRRTRRCHSVIGGCPWQYLL